MLTHLFKKILQIIMLPLFIFGFLYSLMEFVWLVVYAFIFYGLFGLWIYNDPTFSLSKLYYFLGVTAIFSLIIYFQYFYDENEYARKNNEPIAEDVDSDD